MTLPLTSASQVATKPPLSSAVILVNFSRSVVLELMVNTVPDRVPSAAPACDWTTAAQWTFEPVDVEAFPAISLAAEVGGAGGVLPAVFNAADEVAVAAFLAGRLPFPGIVDTVERVVAEYDGRFDAGGNGLRLADVLSADRWARRQAATAVAG